MMPIRPIEICTADDAESTAAFRDRVGSAVDRRDDQRDRHQTEPDVVEHAVIVA